MNLPLFHLLQHFLPPKVEGGFFHNALGRLPALFPALGVLSVLLPELFFPREAFGSLPGWITAFLLLPMIYLFYHEKKAVLLFAAGAFLSFLTLLPGEKGKSVEEYFTAFRPTGVEMEILIKDPALVPELLPNPRTVLMEVKGIRYPGEKEYRFLPEGNELILFLPSRFPRIAYGERFAFKGSIEKVADPLFPGSFSYGEYLQKRGISGIARPHKLEKLGEEKDLSFHLYRIRNLAMIKVLSRIRTPEYRALASAILFGCKQGISRETKEEMIHSGLIHILTVSGLHIGLFAALAGVLLLGFPARARYILIIFFSLLYALATGFGIPAVRALLMISFYCISRAFYTNRSPLNALFFAFALLLLFRKEELTQAGFLYTFSATAILLLSGAFFQRNVIFFREKHLWMADPSNPRPDRKPPFWEKAFFSLFSCLAAWMTTGIISLHFQGVYAPLSPLANLLLLPLIWLFYPIYLLGSLLGICLEGAAGLAGSLLEYLCIILKMTGSFVSSHSFLLPPPGLPLTLLMLFILFLPFLLLRRQMEALLFITLPFFLLFTLFLFAPMGGKEGKLALLEGGGSGEKPPALLYSDCRNSLAFAVNIAGTFPLPQEMAEYFKREGQDQLLFVIATGTRKDDLDGLEYFLKKIPVKNLILPRPAKNSPSAEELLRTATRTGTKIHFMEGKRGKSHHFSIRFRFRGRSFSFSSGELLTLISGKKLLLQKERKREMLPQLQFFPIYREAGKAKNDSAFLVVTLPHSSMEIPLHSATVLTI